MPVADRESLADLLSVVGVLFWLLLAKCTLKLPVVIKVLFLLPLVVSHVVLIRIVVILFDIMSMFMAVLVAMAVVMVAMMAICRISMFIASVASPMKQILLQVDVGVHVRSIT